MVFNGCAEFLMDGGHLHGWQASNIFVIIADEFRKGCGRIRNCFFYSFVKVFLWWWKGFWKSLGKGFARVPHLSRRGSGRVLEEFPEGHVVVLTMFQMVWAGFSKGATIVLKWRRSFAFPAIPVNLIRNQSDQTDS